MHVGVDRHLFAGHRIERETRGDFGDALRAGRDHHELDHDQHREGDQPDDEVAAHDELPEGGHERADAVGQMTLGQDQARRGDVEREPEERGDQERRRERREFQRVGDGDADQQHHARAENVEGQQRVEQRRRQGYEQNAHDGQHRGREAVGRRGIGAFHPRATGRSSAATIRATGSYNARGT